MSHRQCPTTAIKYVTNVDFYDKFMCIQTMTQYMPYIKLLHPKRVWQLQQRFARRVSG